MEEHDASDTIPELEVFNVRGNAKIHRCGGALTNMKGEKVEGEINAAYLTAFETRPKLASDIDLLEGYMMEKVFTHRIKGEFLVVAIRFYLRRLGEEQIGKLKLPEELPGRLLPEALENSNFREVVADTAFRDITASDLELYQWFSHPTPYQAVPGFKVEDGDFGTFSSYLVPWGCHWCFLVLVGVLLLSAALIIGWIFVLPFFIVFSVLYFRRASETMADLFPHKTPARIIYNDEAFEAPSCRWGVPPEGWKPVFYSSSMMDRAFQTYCPCCM